MAGALRRHARTSRQRGGEDTRPPTQEAPKMLTINETAATGILTEHALRVMVAKNEIPHLKVGNRVLLNYDRLVERLQAL